jgi:hypothetical protein
MVNPRGWVSKGFTIESGDYRAYLETEGMGGTFAVMMAAQYAGARRKSPPSAHGSGVCSPEAE